MSQDRNGGRHRLVALLAVLSLVWVAGTATAASLPRRAAQSAGRVRLSSDVLPGLSALRPTGVLAADTAMQIGVALTPPAGQEQATSALYTPGDADYHHFFTPQSWAQRFAVSSATYARVRSQLTRAGLTVGYAAPTRSYLLLDGTAAQVERTFEVVLRTYHTANGVRFYANTVGPTVPVGVDAVLDLQNLVQMHPAQHQSAPVAARAGSSTGPSQGGCVGTTICAGALTARDLWSVYDQPATNTGSGQRVAVIGAGSLTQPVADLRKFEQEFALPRVPVRKVLVDDQQDYTGGEGEWALDSEASTGMAPGVDQIDYYFGESLSGGSTAAAFAAYANDPNGPLQANASFGGCESLNAVLGGIAAEAPIFMQIAAEGRTQFVSTGDTGGSCTVVTGNGFLNTVAPQVEWPASSPWVVAVGGTQLYTNGAPSPRRVLEKAWEYTGGGTSLFNPRPGWQAAIPIVKGQCISTPAVTLAAPGTPCRGLPDVAALSGDITVLADAADPGFGGQGYRDVEGGTELVDGGTSLSSPLWMGMWARIQAAARSLRGLGFAAPALYRQAYNPASDARDFTNIAVGTNGQFQAQPRTSLNPTGWSYTSGLGVPVVANLMRDLTGRLTPAHPRPAGAPTVTTTIPTWICGANGVFVKRSAGSVPAYARSVQLSRVVITYARTAITWTATVPYLANDGAPRTFDFAFSYGGKDYVTENNTGTANTGNFLYVLTYSGGSATYTTLASDLTGTYDVGNHTVSVTLPLREFNADAKPKVAATARSVLAVQDNTSYYALGLSGDDIPGDNCRYRL